jgi:hypothetical protein
MRCVYHMTLPDSTPASLMTAFLIWVFLCSLSNGYPMNQDPSNKKPAGLPSKSSANHRLDQPPSIPTPIRAIPFPSSVMFQRPFNDMNQQARG